MPDDPENYPVTAATGPPVSSGTVGGTANGGGPGPDANIVNLADGGQGDAGGGLGDGGFGGFLDAAPIDAGTVLIPSDAMGAPPFPEGDQIP